MGTGTYAVRVRLEQPRSLSADVPLKFDVFLDEDWPTAEAHRGAYSARQWRENAVADCTRTIKDKN